ncbi:MAG: TolC family protein [Acidobacteriaceae bacterium]
MRSTGWLLTIGLFAAAGSNLVAQSAPRASDSIWQPGNVQSLEHEHPIESPPPGIPDVSKTYTLAELIDLAEQHNPDTRVAWEQAKAKADALGIARSTLYPTMSAVVLADSIRQATLIGEYFHRQTLGIFEPVLHVEYLVFDIGGRSGAIDAAKADLLASDFAFNDTHRRIIYQVASTYYQLLNAEGQRQAAEVSLENAKTVEEDASARLANGLATKPDQLEAAAASAQADYNLQAAVGAVAIARGNLATATGFTATAAFKVQEIDQLQLPTAIADSVNQEIERAFSQRPDLLRQLARLRAADASIKQAKSTYFPSLSFDGVGGEARAYGQQDLLPGTYAEGEIWTAQLTLTWTLFDGARREYRIAQAEADKKAAQAAIDSLRDQIANQTWAAYSDVQTALRQEKAAAALLTASQQSYEAAHEAYGYGVRNLLDVVSAQKTLAQARSEDISARTQLLFQVTNLAFRTGDLIQTQHWSPAP